MNDANDHVVSPFTDPELAAETAAEREAAGLTMFLVRDGHRAQHEVWVPRGPV